MTSLFASRLARLHANHKRIASGAVLIATLTIIAKGFVALREVGIAWRFGVSETIDAYQLAVTITTWLPMMLTSVAAVVLVPRLMAVERQSSDHASFIAELNGAVLLLGVAVMALVLVLAPAATAVLGGSSSRATQDLITNLSRYMAPVGLLMVVTGYLTAHLQARERFAYSVTEALPAVTIAIFTVAPLPFSGVTRLICGTLIGYSLQTGILAVLARASGAWVARVRFRHSSGEWRSLYRSFSVMAAAQATIALTIPIDQAFAVRVGTGAVATMAYANRIVVLATGFGAVILARALLPVLSGTVVRGDIKLGLRQTRQWASLMVIFGAGAAGAIWLLADRGVALAFERGAFTHADTQAVAAVLRVGAVQLPFYFGGLVMMQWLAALGRFNAVLLITCAALALKLLLNFALVPTLGLHGIMLSTAGMYALTFVGQLRAARVR